MLVREFMTARTESVKPDTSLRDAATRMRDRNVGSLLVVENGLARGLITDRDICCRAIAEGRDPAKTNVREIMSKDVTHCFIDDDISEAAHHMESRHIRRLLVLNRDRSMAGFLSVDDLARASHRLAGEVIENARPTSAAR